MLIQKDYYKASIKNDYEVELTKITFKDIADKSNKYALSIEYYNSSINNDANVKVEIFTNGELKVIELNNWTFQPNFDGAVHYPGSFSLISFKINCKNSESNSEFTFEKYLRLNINKYKGQRYGFSNLSIKTNYGKILFETIIKISNCSSSSDVYKFLSVDHFYNKYLISEETNDNYFQTLSNIFDAIEINSYFLHVGYQYKKEFMKEMNYKSRALHKYALSLIQEKEYEDVFENRYIK